MIRIGKSFFSSEHQKLIINSIHYPSYKRPENHLNVSEFIKRFSHLSTEENVTLTGRITCIRSAGNKLHFLDLTHNCSKVQLIMRQDCFKGSSSSSSLDYSSISEMISLLHKGDIVEAVGSPVRSKSGELSCKLERLNVLAPCLINLPDEKIGIKNPDLRSRKRHLDLIANPDSFRIFRMRSKIVSRIRRFLEDRDFLEVETPILSDLSGGAVAKPFRTKLSAQNDRPLSMRIAPELYLKRLLVGGFDRVFEMGKQFRDEGIDATHNPEFTSCEMYSTFTDLEEMISLLQDLFLVLAEEFSDSENVLKKPIKRIDLMDELQRLTKTVLDPCQPESFMNPKLLERIQETNDGVILTPARVFDKLVGLLIEPHCQEPTLLYGPPLFTSPLARECSQRPGIADRFEIFVHGRELVNAYGELNDPEEQMNRFRAQQADNSSEIPEADEDFVEALRAGMPPTTGCGIGIDRLVMLLTGQSHIRNVLLFPLVGSSCSIGGGGM